MKNFCGYIIDNFGKDERFIQQVYKKSQFASIKSCLKDILKLAEGKLLLDEVMIYIEGQCVAKLVFDRDHNVLLDIKPPFEFYMKNIQETYAELIKNDEWEARRDDEISYFAKDEG